MIATVSNTNQLWTALKAAHAGDTILLAPGNYSALMLGNFAFNGVVTIQSADFAHQAVINGISLSNSSGLAFNHLELTPMNGTAVTIGASSAISLDSVKVHGATVGDGLGVMVRDSHDVAITNSDFSRLSSGVNELNSQKLTITGNVFHDLQAESIRGTGVVQETISGNTFADAKASVADHHDVINLWQDNTANHVSVAGNTFGPLAAAPATVATHAAAPVAVTVAVEPLATQTHATTSPDASNTTTTTTTTTTTGSLIPSATNVPALSQAYLSTQPKVAAVHGSTFTVSSSNELWATLKAAHSGDTILLNAGNYGTVNLADFNFSSNVTITSANPANEAMLSGLNINNSSGLVFKNLDVSITGNSYGVKLSATSDMTFTNLKVHGSDPTDQGVGMFVRGSTGVTISNSEFTQLGSGIGHLDDTDLTVINNAFHNMNTDGVFGGGSSNVLVKGNTFTDFHPSAGVHPDAIQFYGGTGGVAGDHVVIDSNVITRGTGDAVQGIFIEHTDKISITNNAITGSMTNGISLSTSNTVLVEDNYVQGFLDMGSRIIVRGHSADVSVVHNTTQLITNYVDGGIANPNFLNAGNTIVGGTAATDHSGVNAWLGAHVGVTVTGTAGADALTGGAGADTLAGMGGADTMTGGFGNDTYIVDNVNDVIVEQSGGGIDTVETSLTTYQLPTEVENLILTGLTPQSATGNAGNNVMTSNGVASTLNGGAGDDTLIVNGGSAVLTGGPGHDTFTFAQLPTSPVQITDFTHGSDVLDLHNLLRAYHGADPVADHWLSFQSDATGTTVLVDTDGPTGAGGFVAVAKLSGLTTIAPTDWIFH